jgi:pimeloyl-[acyl-carrier protein] methyl ester esterase
VPKPLTLVLLPGLDGTSILFRPFMQALPAWIQPRCVEYATAGPHDYAGLLPEIRAACAGLGDFVILGWSFSGPLALMAAAESPPGLRGVVICASFVRAPLLPLRWLRWGAVAPLARLGPLLARMLMSIGGYGSDDLRNDQAEIFRRVTASAFAARARAALGVDVRAAAAGCRVPVLYLAASQDIVVPRWNAAAVTAAVPHGEIVTIRGPHLALRTNPRAGADVVAQFVARLGSA